MRRLSIGLPKGMLYTHSKLKIGESVKLLLYNHICVEDFIPMRSINLIYIENEYRYIKYSLKLNLDKTKEVNDVEHAGFFDLRAVYDVVSMCVM